MKKRNIIINYLYNATYSLLSVIMPLITIPYVSRILLADGVGKVAYAQNNVAYFVMIASLGIPNYGIREIAKCKEDINNRTKVFTEIIIINFVSTSIASIAFLLSLIFAPEFAERRAVLLVCGLTLFFNIIDIDWFYRGMECFKYITTRSYIIKIVSIISIFLFVREKKDLLTYALILTLSSCINHLCNIIHARKYINRKEKFSIEIKQHLKPVFFMFTTTIALELYAQIDVSMIGYLCGERFVAFYSNPRRICVVVTNVITAIGGVLLPQLSLYYKEKNMSRISVIINKAIEAVLLISIPATVGIFFASREIVLILFGNDFISAVHTMKILSLLIPALGVSCIYGTQLMVVLEQEKILSFTIAIGVIINIFLNIFFIKRFQQNGAAFASIIAEYLIMIFQIGVNRRTIKIRFERNFWIEILIQAVILSISVFLVSRMKMAVILKLSMEVIVGILVYIISGWYLNNKLVKMMIGKLLKKRKGTR